jgi:hypothetical protein
VENKQNPSPSQVQVGKSSQPKPKLSSIVGVILLVVIIVTALIVFLHNKSSTKPGVECSTSSMASTMEEASPLLKNGGGSDTNKFKQVVTKIQSIKNYQQDPNCLYPIVAYYISTGDTQSATTYLTKLQAVYKPSVGYNQYIAPNALTIAQLKSEISVVKYNEAELKKSASTINFP